MNTRYTGLFVTGVTIPSANGLWAVFHGGSNSAKRPLTRTRKSYRVSELPSQVAASGQSQEWQRRRGRHPQREHCKRSSGHEFVLRGSLVRHIGGDARSGPCHIVPM